MPEVGRPSWHDGQGEAGTGEGIRSIPYGNYVILFRYNDPYLEIVSIIEGHRDIEELFSE